MSPRNLFISYLKDKTERKGLKKRVKTVLRAYTVVTSSPLESLLEKKLAYLTLRTGYHPVSSTPSFIIICSFFLRQTQNSEGEKSIVLVQDHLCYSLMTITLDI